MLGVRGRPALLAPSRAPVDPYLKLGIALEFVEPNAVLETTYESIHIANPHYWPGFLAAAGVSVPLGGSAGIRVECMIHAIESNPQAMNIATVGLSFWTRFAH